MRRAPIILAATAAGTAGVLAFHPSTPAVAPATASTTATAATPSPTATKRRTTSSGASGASGTATGDAVDTQYGPAQVRVTVAAGKITKIEAIQLQGNDPKSVAISSYAEPILQQEALAAQSASVDAVSGATYTSESYMQSLQSALDKLGFSAA